VAGLGEKIAFEKGNANHVCHVGQMFKDELDGDPTVKYHTARFYHSATLLSQPTHQVQGICGQPSADYPQPFRG